MSATVTLNLPFPPSMNAIWRSVNGRAIKSKKYRDWIAEAGWTLQAQRPSKVSGPVSLFYRFADKPGMKPDLGNLEKGPTDLLVKHGVIEGDSPKFVRQITLAWSKGVAGCQVSIAPMIEAAE